MSEGTTSVQEFINGNCFIINGREHGDEAM